MRWKCQWKSCGWSRWFASLLQSTGSEGYNTSIWKPLWVWKSSTGRSSVCSDIPLSLSMVLSSSLSDDLYISHLVLEKISVGFWAFYWLLRYLKDLLSRGWISVWFLFSRLQVWIRIWSHTEVWCEFSRSYSMVLLFDCKREERCSIQIQRHQSAQTCQFV